MFRVQGFRGLGVCDLGLGRYSKNLGFWNSGFGGWV